MPVSQVESEIAPGWGNLHTSFHWALLLGEGFGEADPVAGQEVVAGQEGS